MAVAEHPERYSLWLNELESLGVNTLEKHGLNNRKEASDLTEAVKQTLYEDYLLPAAFVGLQGMYQEKIALDSL